MAGSPTDPEAGTAPGYVAVPVPEHLVAEVGEELMRLQWEKSGIVQPWHLDALVELLSAADEAVTAAVRLTARTVLADRVLLDVELAERIGLNTRELAGLIREINDSAPPGVLDLVVLHRIERDGAVVREVRMLGEHARRVEQAALAVRRMRRQ